MKWFHLKAMQHIFLKHERRIVYYLYSGCRVVQWILSTPNATYQKLACTSPRPLNCFASLRLV